MGLLEILEKLRAEYPNMSAGALVLFGLALGAIVAMLFMRREVKFLRDRIDHFKDVAAGTAPPLPSPLPSAVREQVPTTSSQLAPETRYQYVDRTYTFFFPESPNNKQWIISIRFRKSGKNLTIRLDYTYHGGGINGRWNVVQHLFVKRLDHFTIGTDQRIPVAKIDTSKPYRPWHWAFGDGGLMYLGTHRCCLAFLIDDILVDQFDFIIDTCKGDESKSLIFIGENRFTFAKDWPSPPAD
jgi:hypothetical protein